MEKTSAKTYTTHHDLFFKIIFQIEREVLRFIEAFLPADFMSEVNKSYFKLDNTTYVDEELQPNFSDICYLTKRLSKKPMRINILFEQKSFRPKPVFPEHSQIAIYKSSIWRLDALNKRKPTFVFAILLHHGKRKYKERKFADCYEDLSPGLRKYVDDIKFFVLDLNKITDEEILEKLGGTIIGSALLALKHAHEPKYFEKNFHKVFNFEYQNYSREQVQLFIKTIFSYLEIVMKMNTHQILEKADNVPAKLIDLTKITIPSIYNEGLQEGINLEAVRKNRSFVISLIKNLPDISDERIADIAAVNVDFVKKIREEMEAPPAKRIKETKGKTKNGKN